MAYENYSHSAAAAFSADQTDVSATLIRLSLGMMYLAHGPLLKAVIFGISNVAAYFESIGLPGPLAYVVMAAEMIGGLCLVFGLWPRLVALALIPILVGSIVFDHGSNGWLFSAPGGGWEYPAFLIVASIAVAMSNGGAYTVLGGKHD